MNKLGFPVTLMIFLNSCSIIPIKSKKSRELERLRSDFNECLKSSCSRVASGWRCVPAAQNRHGHRDGTLYVIIYEIHGTKSAAKTEKSRDPDSIHVLHYIKYTLKWCVNHTPNSQHTQTRSNEMHNKKRITWNGWILTEILMKQGCLWKKYSTVIRRGPVHSTVKEGIPIYMKITMKYYFHRESCANNSIIIR